MEAGGDAGGGASGTAKQAAMAHPSDAADKAYSKTAVMMVERVFTFEEVRSVIQIPIHGARA